jgi:hypothetical protein
MSKVDPWDGTKGSIAGGAVVTGNVRWPDGIANALTISHVSGNDNPGVRLTQSLPSFAHGAKRGYRGYFLNVLPDVHAITSARHPWQDAAGGSNTNWEFNVTVPKNGRYAPYFELSNGVLPGDPDGGTYSWTIDGASVSNSAAEVPKDSVYRFEFLLTHHPTADSLDIEIKMYNADGSIRVDSDRWILRCFFAGCGQGSDVVQWVAYTNFANIRDMQIGVNGWGGGTTNTPYVTWHWGGIAVCESWCGPHAGGR